MSSDHTYDLAGLPDGATLRSVTAQPVVIDGRPALQVQLTDQVALHGVPDVDYVDQPTFVVVPADFTTGTIEVDLRAGLTSTAPDYARGFAGIAYHLVGGGDRFEAVYLRPLNGASLNPPAPRHLRAVQYFAYPDWKYQRLRDTYPEGVYETGADIRPDTWVHLELTITSSATTVTVNGAELVTIESKVSPTRGPVGLFVDIGTRACFANLKIITDSPRSRPLGRVTPATSDDARPGQPGSPSDEQSGDSRRGHP
ncbi:MAG TPA: hypothetical protein VFP34_02835 [Microlunatus sp.]|nr:hypothetical protein [Microlunatus sp.]